MQRMESASQSNNYGSISLLIQKSRSEKENRKVYISYIDLYRGMAVLYMLLIIAQKSFPHYTVYRLFLFSNWGGVEVADLVPSFFIFIVGLCVFYSMTKALRESPLLVLLKKIGKRFFLMLCLGLFLNYIYRPLFDVNTILSLRVPSYLGRLAFCYLILALGHIAGITYLISIVAIMAFIYIYFMHFHLVPFCGLNNITPFCFCGAYIDELLFTKHHLAYPNDPEGLLGSVSAFYTAFNGYLISYLQTENKLNPNIFRYAIVLMIIVNGLLLYLFYFVFNIPINASIYSTSFALWASSVCVSIYFLLYCLFEIAKIDKYVVKVFKPFIWLGENSLVIYILSEVVNSVFSSVMVNKDQSLALKIVSKINSLFETNDKVGELIYAFLLMIIWLGLAFFVHKKKWIFKLS